MATRTEEGAGAFNELVALLLRNEDDEKHATEVEIDMRRLLMMSRDAHIRDQFVQVQGVRRVTLIAKAATNIITQRLCAGILGNLAHSERGRLSASSCDKWQCISHRHQCPISVLLGNTRNKDDQALVRVSAAALLAFSTQSHCQRHLDTVAGIPILLTLLDAKTSDGAATEVAIYAAAVLWNMCKAPALLLKLEVRLFHPDSRRLSVVLMPRVYDLLAGQTIYGILRDQLTRKLTDLLITPLEPFQLFLTPTGERGMPFLLDFDDDNLNVLVTASISTRLDVVLCIQNYVGRARSLTDQFRPKTPPASAVAKRNRVQGGVSQSILDAGTSTAHYDETGTLTARTCAACAKIIRVSRKTSKRKPRQPSFLCSRDGCGQIYHLACSRWATLSVEAIVEITTEAVKTRSYFYCDACVVRTSLCYWDFLAAHKQHEQLLSENLFKSIGIVRIPPTPLAVTTEPKNVRLNSNLVESREHHESPSVVDTKINQEDDSAWPSIMLFDRNANLIGIGVKCFHIPASSQDLEMLIVTVTYTLIRAYPATRQVRAILMKEEGIHSANNTTADVPPRQWEVSYARQNALEIPIKPGNAVFWPASSTRDVLALEYSRRSLDELENAFLYEFQGEQAHDKTFSVGSKTAQQLTSASNASSSSVGPANNPNGLWMTLTPRKGICMKLIAAQLGHLKKLQEVHILHTKRSDKPKPRKLFPRQQLNKIAVMDMTAQ